MSRADVMAVRNKLIGLYLSPDQGVSVASPISMKHFCIPMRITMVSSVPLFTYKVEGTLFKTYLKCHRDRDPEWDIEWPNGSISRHDFKECIEVALIIKQLHKEFPFEPQDNYLQNGGLPIV